jgi:ferredoxin
LSIQVNKSLCSGHARCHEAEPDLFPLDDLGYAEVPDADVPPELQDRALRAIRACPERALSLKD